MSSTALQETTRYLYVGAVLALLAAGLVVRCWGVLPVPLDFWADEAWWATLLQSGEFTQFGFRPAGYMWLCRELLALGSPELMLRLPSLVAGVAALVCLFLSARLSTTTRTAALFVLLVAAFHPKLVVFAKEFKPYSVEVFIFSALTLWTLACIHRGWNRTTVFIAALIALPFCYPVVFLYPGMAIALASGRLALLHRVSARQWQFAALVAIPVLVFLHFHVYERLNAGMSRLLWGAKYDVFPIDLALADWLAWYGEKTWSLVTLPGALDAMPQFGLALFAIGFAAGIAILARARRWGELALLAGPLIMTLAANFLGYWPFGAFRANLFLIPGILLVTAQAVDWLAARQPARWIAYALLGATLLVVASSGSQVYRTKLAAHWAAAPQMTEVIAEIGSRWESGADGWRNVILADWHSWRPILYYLPRNPRLQRDVQLVRGPVADLGALRSMLDAEIHRAAKERRPTRIWLVVTRLDAHAGILDSPTLVRHSVYRHEFLTGDGTYHPYLVELQLGTSPDLLAAASRRYHPRPRAAARTESTGECERITAEKSANPWRAARSKSPAGYIAAVTTAE